jgi:hypothetical protein
MPQLQLIAPEMLSCSVTCLSSITGQFGYRGPWRGQTFDLSIRLAGLREHDADWAI